MGNCWKFKCSVTLTLTLDPVEVTPTCTVRKGYQLVQPCDCSLTQYRNMAIWISWNMDIGRSLNSRDSFSRTKFNNWAQKRCSPAPILSPSTISFELYAKTAEEIDLERWTILNFGRSVTLTLTLDRVEVTLMRMYGRDLRTQSNYVVFGKKNFLWTYGRKDKTSNSSLVDLLGHRPCDDLKLVYLDLPICFRTSV